jgi:MFS family permease
MTQLVKDRQYFKFCLYGFLKNLRFFDAFFILFLMQKGLSFTQIGTLYAIREITINVFEIPSGIIADTFGRKTALAGSFLIYIISFIIFYASTNFWLFFTAFVFYGMADAFRTGTHKGMIMQYLKINNWQNQKINYYGHTRSWSQKGAALSALLAGILVFFSGNYQNIFLFSIVPYLINFALILSYPNELNKTQIHKSENLDFKAIFNTIFKVLKQPRVIKIINTTSIHTAYLKAVKDYIQPLMLQVIVLIPIFYGLDVKKKNGLFIGLIYFVIYLITSKASQVASKFTKRNKNNIAYRTLLIGFGFGVLSGLFYNYNLSILSLIAFIAIYVIENIRKPILTGFIAEEVPNEILTSVISVQSQLKTIMTAALALVFGLCADYLGIGKAFIIISLVLLAFTMLFSYLGKHAALLRTK